MEPKEILIKKEQFIPIMKMFLEDIVEDKLLDKYSEQNLLDGYFSFRIDRIVLDDRLDSNKYTGNLYPHFKVYYEGYMSSDWSRNHVSSFIVVEINKYFSNLVVSPSSFNFIKLEI